MTVSTLPKETQPPPAVASMPPLQHELPVTTAPTPAAKKKLTLIPLIFLIYFEVAGGPYGEEPAVQAAGPLFAILGFLIFPFIWSIPEALITAELSTALPGNGGFVLWADKAFGPFFGSLMAVTGAVVVDQSKWEAGYMADAARTISGTWLKVWIEIGAVLSAVGLFEAQLSSSGYQLLGMADLGLLPKFFALRSKRFNTPWVGILVSTLIAIGVSYMSYTDIVASANFLYSLGMLLEFSSFLWLRWKSPQMNRPYRVPLRLPALIVMCLIPSAFLVFIMAIATKTVYLVSGLMTIGGIGWFFVMNVCKSKGLLHFKSNLEDHDLG
ncbi:UNVERIFIED_CONTAM: putative polyamine transporter [Sesamum angustifolium]|uniref:Polyamine transporter n=1 Tax=Sesamum angustifolium TaxID=2727405 RepID=A0AAW2QQW7_9LAMI